MTRVLATLLGAKQPAFQLQLNQLERASGLPGVDIKLTTDVLQRTKTKIRSLGLDPKDTTAVELYNALGERLKRDEVAINKALGLENAPNTRIIGEIAKFTDKITPDKVFVVKNSSMKRMLVKHNPNKAMKLLGYRSSVSMLKNEPVAQILAAAKMTESDDWWLTFKENYKTLSPSDFEMRAIKVVLPNTARWQKASAEYVDRFKRGSISVQELGVVLLLPIGDSHQIKGLSLVLVLTIVQSVNDIRSASSYLKFNQVKADFGSVVADVSDSRVYVAAKLVNQPIAWQSLHQYYSKNIDKYPAHLFEPHLQSDDMRWDSAENILANLDETLEFWQDSQCCALKDDQGNVVSLNLFDAVLNYCNDLPFGSRVVSQIKQDIWRELTSRYLNQNAFDGVIGEQLSRA